MKFQDETVVSGTLADFTSDGQVPEQHRQWLNTLARNVKHLRQEKNLSQEVLATRCGLYRTYLSRIETGKCNPSLTVLVALSYALDVRPHALLSPLK
jgi:DNA-binding XRE family transcriptional regulator